MADNKLYRHQYHSLFSPRKKGKVPNLLCCFLLGIFSICALFLYICDISVATNSFVQISSLALPSIWELRWSYVKNSGDIQSLRNIKQLCSHVLRSMPVNYKTDCREYLSELHWISYCRMTCCTIQIPCTEGNFYQVSDQLSAGAHTESFQALAFIPTSQFTRMFFAASAFNLQGVIKSH